MQHDILVIDDDELVCIAIKQMIERTKSVIFINQSAAFGLELNSGRREEALRRGSLLG